MKIKFSNFFHKKKWPRLKQKKNLVYLRMENSITFPMAHEFLTCTLYTHYIDSTLFRSKTIDFFLYSFYYNIYFQSRQFYKRKLFSAHFLICIVVIIFI